MTDALARSLTDAKVRSARPAAKPYKLADGGGLFLLVQPGGSKLWRFKFRVAGKEGLQSLGAYPDVGLREARRLHQEARTMVAGGQNPVKVRQAERTAREQAQLRADSGAFDAVVDSWMAATKPTLAPLTIQQRTRELDRELRPAFRGRGIETITRVEMHALLKRIEARAPETAKNVRMHLHAMFEHAIDAGLVNANPVPPIRTLARRRQQPHAALPAARLPAFLEALDGATATRPTRIAMELIILTACRKGEIAYGRWAEIDLAAAEWLIPAERMKARRPHRVALSRQAIALLRELRAFSAGEYLFAHRDQPGRPMHDRTLNALMERVGYAGLTVHGFRSLFSTHWNAAGANPDVIEHCLAHVHRDQVRAAYNRADMWPERQAMMQAWGDFVQAARGGQPRLALVA